MGLLPRRANALAWATIGGPFQGRKPAPREAFRHPCLQRKRIWDTISSTIMNACSEPEDVS
jgi:hypothetical protein